MRMPVRHLAGNLVWTRHGTVWALYRVEGEGQTHASVQAQTRRLRAIEQLVKKLHGESMWLSLCPQVDPASIVRRMTDGLVLTERFEEMAHRVLDGLEELELTARTHWLAVPLAAGGWKEQTREVLRAAGAEMAVHLGLLPGAISAREEERRAEQARQMAAVWPRAVQLRPASEAEVLWIYGHAARRGVLEPLLPAASAPRGVRGRGRGVAALEQAILVEGGREEDLEEDAAARGAAESAGASSGGERDVGRGVFGRRWLQVTTPWGPSYQAMLSLAEMPEQFIFPGSEYLARLEEFAFPVDWVMRLQVTPGATAEAKMRRQRREVAQQPEEYAADPAGVPAKVPRAAEDLAEASDRLTSTGREVEVRAMGALCVWGASVDEVEARAAELASWFDENEYALARPVGEQERLWYGMLPGARTPAVMGQYAQYLLAQDFAMAAPFAGSGLGDERGPLFGLQSSRGGVSPVLMDFTRGPGQKTSASAAFLGELGSGKSTAMKAAAHGVLMAGRRRGRPGSRGRVVAVDRTERQEWVSFLRACPGQTQVVTVDADARVSLDPLRLLTRRRGGRPADVGGVQRGVQRRTETFLGMLLGLDSASEETDVLSETIETVLTAPEPCLAGLLRELGRRAQSGQEVCARLARRLQRHARSDLGAVLFDPTLPVLDAAADSVVFAVANLKLPSQTELASSELFRKLPLEAVFGRAVLYLIAAISQHIAFEEPGEFCEVVWDECWWLTASPEGLELLLQLVRDGRKHNAGVLVGSHDAHDIGPDTEAGRILRGLFPRRFLFRQTTAHLAARALSFLGLDGRDRDLLERVQGLSPLDEDPEVQAARAGECLGRDLFGRIGPMQVLIPLDPQAAEAIHSDPAPHRDLLEASA